MIDRRSSWAGKLVTALDATVPYSKPMEEYLLPDEQKIAAAVRAVVP